MGPRCGLLLVTLAACSPRAGDASGGSSSHANIERASVEVPRCDFASIGLGDATSVSFRAPAGCSAREASAEPIRDEAGFQAAFGCKVPSGIDLGPRELHVEMRELSPAGVGIDVVDDGTTLTFVQLQSEPCPGAAHPMPIPVPVAYSLPRGAERETAAAACPVRVSCQ